MILNLAAYHFVAIDDADALIATLRQQTRELDLKGTILVAPEGINVFLAGPEGPMRSFVAWLCADRRFASLVLKWSTSSQVPFRRMLVKKKREIITFRQNGLDPASTRAPAVTPDQLRVWLARGHDDNGRALVLVDTRNAQEVAYGTFENALTLPIACFTELPQALEAHRDALRDKTVVSFCTGGIRCEKAAVWMQQAGYGDVWQLDGGILGYFEHVGGFGYRDRCFVFDERVALDPQLRPLVDGAEPVH